MKYSFEKYCKDYENIENYEKAKKDNFKGWEVHHRLETHNSDGERRLVDITADELKALNLYYHRPPEELIFLRKGEHTALRKVSDSTREKLRAAKKGKYIGENHPNYGKHFSADHKKKIGAANKGKNLGNTNVRGRHWYNNGKENKYCYECPPGFVPGMLKRK